MTGLNREKKKKKKKKLYDEYDTQNDERSTFLVHRLYIFFTICLRLFFVPI